MSTHTLNEINEPIFINYHKKTWKNTVYISWFIYIIFQLGLYINSYNNNICNYNHYDKSFFGNYYWYSNYSAISVFIILWVLIFIKIGLMDANKKRIPMLLTLNVISISTLTSGLNIFWEKGSVCIDTLGVATPTAIWAEWLVCGPQTIYIILTITYFNDFTYIDYALIASFFLCIMFGFLIVIPQPIELARFWLFMSCISYVCLHYLPFYKAKINTISEYAIISNDMREKIYKQQSIIRTKLSIWMSIVLPFYTFTYLFGMFRIFNYSQTMIAFNILSVVTKGVFIAFCSDIHLKLLSTAEELVITERKINIARREFMKFIFHEVRNPLNTISIGLDLLKITDYETDKTNYIDTLNMMRISSNNMTETLNGILNMHQIEEGKLELNYIDTDIRKIIQNIKNEMNIYILQKSLKIIIDIDDNIPNSIKLDGVRIEQVLSKLINNAIKYSPVNGKIIVCLNITKYAPFDRRIFSFIKKNVVYNNDSVHSVHIRPAISKPYNTLLNISVADEGLGICQHDKINIFNNFAQIRPISLKNENWGLNLAFCKKIIKLHGGNIWVESEPGKGSVFRFKIPIYDKHYHSHDDEDEQNHEQLRFQNAHKREQEPDENKQDQKIVVVQSPENSESSLPRNNCAEQPQKPDEIRHPEGSPPILNDAEEPLGSEASGVFCVTPFKERCAAKLSESSESEYITKPPPKQIQEVPTLMIDSNGTTRKLNDDLCVLIVDDSETNCKMLAKLLKMNHIESDIAENGKIAVDMVLENINKYSFIFMDNLMPTMNGCIATTIIRNAGYKNIIAGVTGNILDEDINEFLESGANIVYKKPISILSIKILKKYIERNGIIIEKNQKLIETEGTLVKH